MRVDVGVSVGTIGLNSRENRNETTTDTPYHWVYQFYCTAMPHLGGWIMILVISSSGGMYCKDCGYSMYVDRDIAVHSIGPWIELKDDHAKGCPYSGKTYRVPRMEIVREVDCWPKEDGKDDGGTI